MYPSFLKSITTNPLASPQNGHSKPVGNTNIFTRMLRGKLRYSQVGCIFRRNAGDPNSIYNEKAHRTNHTYKILYYGWYFIGKSVVRKNSLQKCQNPHRGSFKHLIL